MMIPTTSEAQLERELELTAWPGLRLHEVVCPAAL